ncbi:MAG: hypothetical protein QOF31_2484 [Mycobacterium sp.]|jgi:hypothetical protein|nr:hypothetical protein [Mycobacterium sp.]
MSGNRSGDGNPRRHDAARAIALQMERLITDIGQCGTMIEQATAALDEPIDSNTENLGHIIVLWSWALKQPNPEAIESTTVHFRSLDGHDREIPVPRLTFTEPITTLAGAST